VTLARRYAGLVGLSAVLLVFSEFVFLNEGVVAPLLTGEDGFGALLQTGEMLLFYLLFGAIFAAVVSAYGAATVPALLLAGAICGWGIEAVLVPLVYEAVPYSFAWPSLGWHMLIDVAFGLFLLPALLAARSRLVAVTLLVFIGLLWGAWASWIWIEDLRPTPWRFAVFAAVVIALLAAGYALLGWAGADAFSFGRRERATIGIIAVALGAVTGSPYMPWPLIVAALAGLALLALARGARRRRGFGRLPLAERRLPPARLALLALVAPTATLSYAWMYAGTRMIEVDLIAAPLMLAGTVIFLWALLREFTRA